MKNSIRKAALSAGVVVLLATASVTAWAALITKFEKLGCDKSYGDAYLVTAIEPAVGCILSQYGVGCDGQPFRHDFLIKPRPSDIGMPFDYQYSGVTSSGAWYLKIDYNEGAFVRAWGKKADGSYYEATLE